MQQLSGDVRRLQRAWLRGQGWPHRLEWLELQGLRGWAGQRVDFAFPIVALTGENGSGKSTVLQGAAAVYRQPEGRRDQYASDYFPDTPFERVVGVTLRFSYRQGNNSLIKTIRKPADRWRGNPDRPERSVTYIDLRRIQPVGARVGYSKLLRSGVLEDTHRAFDDDTVGRLSNIIGKTYEQAGMSSTTVDAQKPVPVLRVADARYSGFHQGAGEIAAAELLAEPLPRYGLVLIDEVETSLHPRAQRRLIRELARLARELELQIVLTTHSPYVLSELPPEGRIYLMEGTAGKTPVTGVSPEFAMTRMDDEQHPECDVYVEDVRAEAVVREAVVRGEADLTARLQIIPYGSSQVGVSLGTMRAGRRFPRPSVVFLDGDEGPREGCDILPGGDAPEIVVFEALRAAQWHGVPERVGRRVADTIDALNAAMRGGDHHDWVREAADKLYIGSDILWQALAAQWASDAPHEQIENIVRPIREALE